ncbi:MAG: hypothetical protein MJZ38_07100, partial [archaeon]|nr:hypothetical protein [archaeon]
ASAMGHRSALLLFIGHMAASVEIPDGSVTMSTPATFVRSGVTYYYCETTTTGWVVGSAPKGYTYGGQYYTYPDNQAIMPVAANYRLSDIDFDGSEAVINKSDIHSANEAGNGLSVRSDSVTVDLSSETVAYLDSLGYDLTFGFSEADPSVLTPEQIEAIGNLSAYSITLMHGDPAVTDLHGTVTIHVRYEVPTDRSVRKVIVRCVAEDGSVEEMESATYSHGFISFETTHFSVYSVEVEYGGETFNPFVFIIVAAGAVVCAGILILVRRR